MASSPSSFAEKLQLPKFEEITSNLLHKEGRDFEKAVCTAFNFLDFDASLTLSTQAESDVIAEAYYAENPYFIVIECQAVLPQNQVGVEKVGQIRGNAESYSLDPRRQRLFATSHKLVVGRPIFSSDARKRSLPDVGLITAANLCILLLDHKLHRYSQDELRDLLGVSGEVTSDNINSFDKKVLAERQFHRKLEIYSLVYIGLLEDPIADNLEKRKNWVSIDTVVGTVQTYASLFRMSNISKEEIIEAIRDLDNPFLNIVKRKVNAQGQLEVRLSTISRPFIQISNEFGKALAYRIAIEKIRLRTLAGTGQSTPSRASTETQV